MKVMGEFETVLDYSICFGYPFLFSVKGLWGELTSRMRSHLSALQD